MLSYHTLSHLTISSSCPDRLQQSPHTILETLESIDTFRIMLCLEVPKTPVKSQKGCWASSCAVWKKSVWHAKGEPYTARARVRPCHLILVLRVSPFGTTDTVTENHYHFLLSILKSFIDSCMSTWLARVIYPNLVSWADWIKWNSHCSQAAHP